MSGISRNQTTKTVKTTKTAIAKKAPEAKKPAVKTTQSAMPAAAGKKPEAKKPAVNRKHVTFRVKTKPGSKVYLAGDFNDWNHLEKELSDQDGSGLYEVAVVLEAGVYEYKFHINDIWCVDPENPDSSPNPMGTLNSVIIVE
jgi:1,4-alpha-glucan branching enzyme